MGYMTEACVYFMDTVINPCKARAVAGSCTAGLYDRAD